MTSSTCMKSSMPWPVDHRVIILNRGSTFGFQWREFSPPLSSAHSLLRFYHSQWEIGDAAIPGEFSPQPPTTIGPLANNRAVSSDVTLWRCTFWSGKKKKKICISFFLFYCEGLVSLYSSIMTLSPWPA